MVFWRFQGEQKLTNSLKFTEPFKRQPYKIVKHTQTIRRLLPTNCSSVSDHFVGLAFKGLRLETKCGDDP